jgi:hypothetical protein
VIADGKYELALSEIDSTSTCFGNTESIGATERSACQKLMGKYANADPFKYILYSANVAEATLLLSVRPTAKGLKEEMQKTHSADAE